MLLSEIGTIPKRLEYEKTWKPFQSLVICFHGNTVCMWNENADTGGLFFHFFFPGMYF